MLLILAYATISIDVDFQIGVVVMRGISFAWSDGEQSLSLLSFLVSMGKRAVSIFVDESGIVGESAQASRYYVLAFIFHDQCLDISRLVSAFDRELDTIGIANLCFHAGPIIHANDRFEFMNWDLRRKIFMRMMGFARRVPFSYHCLSVDKKYYDSPDRILEQLNRQLSEFADLNRTTLAKFDEIKIYYDCGQKLITNFLHDFSERHPEATIEFAQAVEPKRYKLFQIADLVCTLRLIELKLASGDGMSRSECRFFGGPKKFRHNILRQLKTKEI